MCGFRAAACIRAGPRRLWDLRASGKGSAMSRASLQRAPAGEPRRLVPVPAGESQPGARRRRPALLVAVLIVVLAAAAAGAGTWYALRPAPAAHGPAVLHPSTPVSPSTPAGSSTPAG